MSVKGEETNTCVNVIPTVKEGCQGVCVLGQVLLIPEM